MNSPLFIKGPLSINSLLFIKGHLSINSLLFIKGHLPINSPLFTISLLLINSSLFLNSPLFLVEDYTGAPYYAGMAALRTGAELVYVYTAEDFLGRDFDPSIPPNMPMQSLIAV